MRPKAEWAIDSEPIRARGIIVNYYVIFPCDLDYRASYQNRCFLECLPVFSLLMFYYLDYLATVTYRYLSSSFHLFLQILSSFNLSLCFPPELITWWSHPRTQDVTQEIRVSCAMPKFEILVCPAARLVKLLEQETLNLRVVGSNHTLGVVCFFFLVVRCFSL